VESKGNKIRCAAFDFDKLMPSKKKIDKNVFLFFEMMKGNCLMKVSRFFRAGV